jgi:L-2-hydroxyglutarate oxidase LhgO
MAISKCDVIVIGAGVIGLSTAMAVKKIDPNLKVFIVDKESEVGIHASGRNSGVIHAGFYYSPDSLKARFCRDGNRSLRQLIQDWNLQIKVVGKVVVARNLQESIRLEGLYRRGLENGVELELLEARELSSFEPLARTYQSFLWSPTTSVANPHEVNNALLQINKNLGVEIIYNARINHIDDDKAVGSFGEIHFNHLINAAGAGAIKIANEVGLGENYEMMPFLGQYKYTTHSELPIRTLVYPVPHEINPFLGVHLTLAVDGKVKIGPTALPVFGGEQYEIRDIPKLIELYSTLRGMKSLMRGKKHSLLRMAMREIAKLNTNYLVREVSHLVPLSANVTKWESHPAGIRAQLVAKKDGGLVQDFVIEHWGNQTHVLNAVSPGWTSSIPFGEFIAKSALKA